MAIESPLLDNVSIKGARGVLMTLNVNFIITALATTVGLLAIVAVRVIDLSPDPLGPVQPRGVGDGPQTRQLLRPPVGLRHR